MPVVPRRDTLVAPHAPFLRRLARRGKQTFTARASRRWLFLGLALLALLGFWPVAFPSHHGVVERLATLAALLYLFATPGLWLGMRRRAFSVAFVLVLALYVVTGWTSLLGVRDLFVVALILGFVLFFLAGLYLVWILEEVVHDIHDVLPDRSLWKRLPAFAALALAAGLPWWRRHGGPELPALWWASLAAVVLLGSWWLVQSINRLPDEPVLTELHLFSGSLLAAAAIADGFAALRDTASLVPTVIAYAVLLGTWVYVSYTTLQRTHFLLPGRDPLPWLSLMLAASFAVLAHSLELVGAAGARAVIDLAEVRVNYLVAGAWTGVLLYLGRTLWRIVLAVRGGGGLLAWLAGGGVRIHDDLQRAERLVEHATFAFFREMERIIPGHHQAPRWPRGWELDTEGIAALEDE